MRKLCYFILITVFAAVLTAGCGSRQAAQQGPQAVEVKAMQVIKRDTPVTYEFVGQVQAKNEVQIRAKVSGNIVAKMVTGGATVSEGQPLFQIDRRQYEAALLTAKAQLAQSEAVLSNSRLDSIRYKKLADQQAIARQSLDTQLALEQQNAAAVAANQAKVQQAENDLQDTLIVAPFSGRIDVNELSIGGFVQAGSTVLATISSVDPVFVQFSMSENEYLKFTRLGATPDDWGKNLKLVLSDGTEYPLTGKVEQVDRGLAQNTGTLTLKAAFDNPQKILVPGMFARVVAQGEMRQGALLIPQRAVQQILDKNFVTVVAEGDKAETRPVKLGTRIGNLWLVEEGLTENDRIVVEGALKLQPGTHLKVVMIGPDDLQTQAKQ
ncbi:Multidrug efflux pump subunit AcrA [Sporomusa carbonis]|uniref:efflux RND transporter periplasmic adaptor subunit n=1 Tax=Sporomusa carbonis TaxID=3076075 RepID=UPI003A6F8AF9